MLAHEEPAVRSEGHAVADAVGVRDQTGAVPRSPPPAGVALDVTEQEGALLGVPDRSLREAEAGGHDLELDPWIQEVGEGGRAVEDAHHAWSVLCKSRKVSNVVDDSNLST
ncbi:hypothetical protein GCM10025866_14080 [Naasia aerilata]|uniref:Uncharacterized protein n=1 Tax=Naasia aerilata TaxID=1162966 RepID=A0ABM8GB89_9MICO|nr:hypothetical protein GCM10025866_14080 [Naasia aerilata]